MNPLRILWNKCTYVEELSGVLISVINTDCSSAESDIKADSEVSWLEWHV